MILAFPKPVKQEKRKRPLAERICRNFDCRTKFMPTFRAPRAKYCPECSYQRKLAKFDAKRQSFGERKKAALQRRAVRRASHKRKKRQYGAYPNAGFAAKRAQLLLFQPQCAITGISDAEHKKRFGSGLHLDHIVPARYAIECGVNPHDDRNLIWLCSEKHGEKKRAEEKLRRGNFYGYVLQLKRDSWPMEKVKVALEYCGRYSDNLPWGDWS